MFQDYQKFSDVEKNLASMTKSYQDFMKEPVQVYMAFMGDLMNLPENISKNLSRGAGPIDFSWGNPLDLSLRQVMQKFGAPI